MKSKTIIKSILWGVVASLALLIFYLTVMFLTMSLSEVWFNFRGFWYLISGLIVGFGTQIGLWVYLKSYVVDQLSKVMPGTSGAISGTAMVACCAHHLIDVLPILGISGAAIFLARYQRPFLILGLTLNILGIAYMLYILQKHKTIGLSDNLEKY